MSNPPEQPYYYPHTHDEPPTPQPPPPRQNSRQRFVLAAFAVSVLVGLLVVYLRQPTSPAVPPRNASTTAEAQSFATAQVYRQATRLAADQTAIAQARSTATAEVIAAATHQAQANQTATVAAHATAQAPATQTAQALRFEKEQAQANATAQAMDQSATLVYGPANGKLDHTATSDVPCEAGAPDQLTNFIAEARFYNPYPIIQNGWDYGFAITNPTGDQYVAGLDSESGRFFSLQAPGYTIQYRNTSSRIDLSEGGSNLIKLYVQNEVAHLYINGHFDATQDLTALHFGGPDPSASASHGLLACTGLNDGDMQPGASTRFEGFTIWSAP